MAEQMSLADQAVETLAMVRAMTANMDNDRPERHQVRQLKRLAEAAIQEGLRRAQELAYLAQDLPNLVQEVEKQTRKAVAGMQPVEVERA
jgi:hypothetical protein